MNRHFDRKYFVGESCVCLIVLQHGVKFLANSSFFAVKNLLFVRHFQHFEAKCATPSKIRQKSIIQPWLFLGLCPTLFVFGTFAAFFRQLYTNASKINACSFLMPSVKKYWTNNCNGCSEALVSVCLEITIFNFQHETTRGEKLSFNDQWACISFFFEKVTLHIEIQETN